jgi:hypothetical protein
MPEKLPFIDLKRQVDRDGKAIKIEKPKDSFRMDLHI